MIKIMNFEYVNNVRLEKGERKVVRISLLDIGYEVLTTVYTASKPRMVNRHSKTLHGNKVEGLTKQYLKRGYNITSYGETEIGR